MFTYSVISIKDICSLRDSLLPKSYEGHLWSFIITFWPWGWSLTLLGLTFWIIYELRTRYGTTHYNSKNGFSPAFNRFVGSGTYITLQTFIYLIFKFLIGDWSYCLIWPYAVHATIFLSTGLLLHLSGFWPYLKEPGSKRRGYYKHG